jgi:hypothetical protein
MSICGMRARLAMMSPASVARERGTGRVGFFGNVYLGFRLYDAAAYAAGILCETTVVPFLFAFSRATFIIQQ